MHCHLAMLHFLLPEWMTACLALGRQVRNCNWAREDSGSGNEMKEVLLG